MKRIPIAGPSITELEVERVAQAVREAWYDGSYTFNARFEGAFAGHCRRRFAVSLPSCTSALHLALLALGIGPGDEVIVPDVTWIASAAPISYVGATPVFADIDPMSWCLSAGSLEACITPRTKAAIVVDLYGAMPDWDQLAEVAQKHGIVLIEDAAEAVGSLWRDRPAGAFGLMSAFSFHGSKTLTTGEGGMLVLDDEQLLQRIYRLRDHGRKPGDTDFFNEEVACKYRMSSLQAALGSAQLERLDELVAGKRRIFSWYRELLEDCSGLSMNPDIDGLFNSYWMSTIVFDDTSPVTKDLLIPRLRALDIDVRPFFHPLSSIPAYRDSPQAAAARLGNTVAHRIAPRGLNLPSALCLTRGDVETVALRLKEIIAAITGGS